LRLPWSAGTGRRRPLRITPPTAAEQAGTSQIITGARDRIAAARRRGMEGAVMLQADPEVVRSLLARRRLRADGAS